MPYKGIVVRFRGGIDLTVEYLYKCRCCGEVFTDVIENMTNPQFVAILDNYCNDKASDFPNKTVCYGCNNIRDNKHSATYGVADFVGARVCEED